MRKVMIATPSYSGYTHFNHASSVMNTILTGPQHGLIWVRGGALGCPVLPRVRNVIVAQMLADPEIDGILFVDDDIAFEAEDAVRIVSHGEWIVAGAAQKRLARSTDAPELNAAIDRDAPMDPRGLIANSLVPSCFLWIDRRVFETLLANEELRERNMVRRFIYHTLPDHAQEWCATYFGYGLATPREDGPEMRIAQRLGIENPLVDIGEDYDFSIKCDVAGIPRYVDSKIELVHYDGRVAHEWSFERMLKKGAAVLGALQAAE